MAKAQQATLKGKKPSKKQTKTSTHGLVTFLLDRSGSMEAVKSQTIEAFNAYTETLKKEGGDITFNFIQFDTTSIDKVHVNVPVKDVVQLTDASYQPRGGTPLIDAACKTIKAVEKTVSEMASKPRVVVCIQTDGEENSSIEYTWAQLTQLIKEKTADGWEFVFMGCGIDAYAQGARMGISAGSTVSYGKGRGHTMAAFRGMASNTAAYSTGATQDMAFTVSQKTDSGDVFDPKLNPLTPPPTPQKQPVTPPLGGVRRPSIVDDFTL